MYLHQACGCVCWSPASIKDHTRVAAGYGDGTLRIFQLASTEMEIKMYPHQVAVTAIQYSAHGEKGNKALSYLSWNVTVFSCPFVMFFFPKPFLSTFLITYYLIASQTCYNKLKL